MFRHVHACQYMVNNIGGFSVTLWNIGKEERIGRGEGPRSGPCPCDIHNTSEGPGLTGDH